MFDLTVIHGYVNKIFYKERIESGLLELDVWLIEESTRLMSVK